MNDINNPNRVEYCSTMERCYNNERKYYDDYKCPAEEKCATWEADKEYDGCIREQYCNMDLMYGTRHTRYNCVNGLKKEDGNEDGYESFVNLSRFYKSNSITLEVPSNRDILVVGDDLTVKPGYEWFLSYSTCQDD